MPMENLQARRFFEAGQALLRAHRPLEAVNALEQSAALAPDVLETRVMLGDALLQVGRRTSAMKAYKHAIDHDSRLRAVCRDTTQMPNEDDRSKAVVENCNHILAYYPRYAPAHYSKACALLSLGQAEEARRASEQALVIDPTVPSYYHILVHTGEARHIAAALQSLEALTGAEDQLGNEDRATLHFLLARAYDVQERHADAFAHLQKANALKRGMIVYDEARELGRMQAIAAAFTPGRVAALSGQGNPSPLPVFIVGMPRSGTTLVEQILASHPEVHGAGESTFLYDLVAQGAAGRDFPAGFDTVTPNELARLGQDYVTRLALLAPAAQRIVDKLPYNFLHVGLIHLALQHAKIIHIKRDALDTCLSCYQQTFAGEVGFAYDQGELGRYYRAYEALMAHWRQVLPSNAMLEVQYEELVSELPSIARRMVKYCGLEWDDRCAEFHKTSRAVLTASLYQVRQPVYRKAIGRAEAYADHLAPLRKALVLS